MSELLHEFIAIQAARAPSADAVFFKDEVISYGELDDKVQRIASGLRQHALAPDDRVGIYLPKQPEALYATFGAAAADGVFVPINPLLKPRQVAYIVQDCNVRVLFTSAQRLQQIAEQLRECRDLEIVCVVEEEVPEVDLGSVQVLPWQGICGEILPEPTYRRPRIDADMVAILYTSGSTGNPKGVVLSHRNMVAGAKSSAKHLEISTEDRLLLILPITFDAGFSLVTAAFWRGGSVVMMEYLLPRDVIRAFVKYRVTGTTAVPPIWNQIAEVEWPPEVGEHLRFLTNTGGAMPVATTRKLRQLVPQTDIVLQYGLTEAFRSLYLDPSQVDIRPTSVGKPLPNAEVLVVRPDGTECAPHEPGELVHRGAFVAMGYWNDPEKTAERFKPAPGRASEIMVKEIAVWSGDEVKRDEEGYIYFVSRKDEMIKTSGYRVSPTEVEKVVYESGKVKEAAVIGVAHAALGKAILLLAVPEGDATEDDMRAHCLQELPNYMLPAKVILLDHMPRNQNGKIDRSRLAEEYADIFSNA